MNKRDQRIEDHLNCVHWVIHSFIGAPSGVCGLEYDDLYPEGCIALWRAAKPLTSSKASSSIPTPYRSSAII